MGAGKAEEASRAAAICRVVWSRSRVPSELPRTCAMSRLSSNVSTADSHRPIAAITANRQHSTVIKIHTVRSENRGGGSGPPMSRGRSGICVID